MEDVEIYDSQKVKRAANLLSKKDISVGEIIFAVARVAQTGRLDDFIEYLGKNDPSVDQIVEWLRPLPPIEDEPDEDYEPDEDEE